MMVAAQAFQQLTIICDEPRELEVSRRSSRPPTSDIQPPTSDIQPPTSDLRPPESDHLTEQQLFEIWRGQRFPEGALVTRQGVPVRVISPGRPGRGPGPDFRGAAIAGPSGVTLKGDVELHVRASSFTAHGHATDMAYRDVVLHVVFEDDLGEDTRLPGGKVAPVVALEPWVARREGEIRHWLERPLLWMEPCHDAVLRMGADGVQAALDAEGDLRFDEKVTVSREAIAAHGVEQALYAGLLEALGFGGNAAPMRALAEAVPWRALEPLARDAIAMEALLLGGAGLLPSQRGYAGPLDGYVVELEGAFARSGRSAAAMGVDAWKLWGVRPANHPARRIAAAAALLSRLDHPSRALSAIAAAKTADAIALLTVNAVGFWSRHFDVCAGPCLLPLALIGRSRAIEMLVNVVLPVAASTGDNTLGSEARALYARLPRPAAYGKTKFIENALASMEVPLRITARRAQGLLALERDWCTQNGCGRCSLSS